MADGDFIDYLVAHGAYVEAAKVAAARGELARAITLYERVWRFADAWPLAMAMGDPALAVRLALDANQPGPSRGDRGRRPTRGGAPRWPGVRGARAVLRGGAPGRARRRVAPRRRPGTGSASAPLDEARAESAGRPAARGRPHLRAPHRAGQRRGVGRPRGWRWDGCWRGSAAPRTPRATCRPPPASRPGRPQAWRALCGPLLALGLRGAAAELADRLRARDPASPATPDEIAAWKRRTAQAAAGGTGELGGRYQLRRLLGAGAVGRVYEAFDNAAGGAGGA